MLGTKRALATLAVRDLAESERFYRETLGLEVSGREGEEVVAFKAAGSDVLLYRSDHAGSNRATAVTWTVGEDLEAIVEQLEAAGVEFQHYELPGLRRQRHVHVGGAMRVAWFKDPDGNIHSLVRG